MVSAQKDTPMEAFIQAIGTKTSNKALESTLGQMENITADSGNKIRSMELVSTSGKMAPDSLVK
jgi:hypothetical protein